MTGLPRPDTPPAATEPAHLARTRQAYDAVATDYAALLQDELAGKPLDRALLATFAELVLEDGGGPVADVGCGPGRVTAHLHELGLLAHGVDLSPGMVAVARDRHPHLRFAVGSMTALDLPDAGLAGALAWYSLIHVPPSELPVAAAELARVLRCGAPLLVAFQTGAGEVVHRQEAYGHAVELTSHRHPVELVAHALHVAGLDVGTRVLREPEGWERAPQAYLLARKRG